MVRGGKDKGRVEDGWLAGRVTFRGSTLSSMREALNPKVVLFRPNVLTRVSAFPTQR